MCSSYVLGDVRVHIKSRHFKRNTKIIIAMVILFGKRIIDTLRSPVAATVGGIQGNFHVHRSILQKFSFGKAVFYLYTPGTAVRCAYVFEDVRTSFLFKSKSSFLVISPIQHRPLFPPLDDRSLSSQARWITMQITQTGGSPKFHTITFGWVQRTLVCAAARPVF